MGEVVIMRKTAKKKTVLRIVKETYGTKNIEQAFREALEPYFLQKDVSEDTEDKRELRVAIP
jgi:hypothetical protein